MLSALLTTKQTEQEILNRLIKAVQQLIIHHMDIHSEQNYRVKWPLTEFCKACKTVNPNIDAKRIFIDALVPLCEESGWRLSLSGPDWETSEFMHCHETVGARSDMLESILFGGEEADDEVAVVIKEKRDGKDGWRVAHGKRSAVTIVGEEVPQETAATKKANTASSSNV